MRELDDKVALITGAGSGQGRAAACLFASHGARIAVVDKNSVGARETVALVEEQGGAAIAIHADISNPGDVQAMIDETMARFGRLDVLYNNAAIQMSGTLAECSEADWDITMTTNLTAVFQTCRVAIPHMLKSESGSIINTASVLGQIGSPGYIAYGPSKAGLIALTRQLAAEYGPSIRANVIAPGSIDTPRFRKVVDAMDDGAAFVEKMEQRIPLKRLGTAEDVAAIALFLASDASRYMTGAILPADGGLEVLR